MLSNVGQVLMVPLIQQKFFTLLFGLEGSLRIKKTARNQFGHFTQQAGQMLTCCGIFGSLGFLQLCSQQLAIDVE